MRIFAFLLVFFSFLKISEAKIGDNYSCLAEKALRNGESENYNYNILLKWGKQYIYSLDNKLEAKEYADLRYNLKYKIIEQKETSFIAYRKNGQLLVSIMLTDLDEITLFMSASNYDHAFSSQYKCKTFR